MIHVPALPDRRHLVRRWSSLVCLSLWLAGCTDDRLEIDGPALPVVSSAWTGVTDVEGSTDPEAPARNDAVRLARAFESASRRWGVPRPILESIGWVESRWWMHPEGPSQDGGWGIMHLVDARTAEVPGVDDVGTLAEAARLTGSSIQLLQRDMAANIDGAAALLRARADKWFSEHPERDPSEPGTWWQPVMHGARIDQLGLAESYATAVFRTLAAGASTHLPDGSVYVLGPRTVDLRSERMVGDPTFGTIDGALTPDYPQAAWRPAPATHFTSGRSGRTIDQVVIHVMQGRYSGTVNYLQNTTRSVSVHYCISSTDTDAPVQNPTEGDVTQMVEEQHTAWHAGDWDTNLRSIGIEHEGFVNDPAWFTDAMYRASANLVAWICDRHGIPKDRQHIIAHHEVPGCVGWGGGSGCHVDPCYSDANGRMACHWDWTRYMQMVGAAAGNGGVAIPPGTLRGTVYSSTGGSSVSGNTAPIGGATLSIPETGQTVTAGPGGNFSIDLAPGVYRPIASAPGHAAGSPFLGLTRTIVSGQTTWSSFVLQATQSTGRVEGTISGRSTSGVTAPLAGAQVQVGTAVDTTDAAGAYAIDLPAGTYDVRVSATGYVESAGSVQIALGTTRRVDLTLDEAIIPDTTAPVVRIVTPSQGWVQGSPDLVVAGTVDDPTASVTMQGQRLSLDGSGQFQSATTLTVGTQTIIVEAVDAAGNLGRATVNVTYDTTRGSVLGIVNDLRTGQPVAGVVVTAGDLTTQTTAEGSFWLDVSATTDTLDVTLHKPGYVARSAVVPLAAGRRTDAVVLLVPADQWESLVVIDEPTSGATVTAGEVTVRGSVAIPDATVEVNGVAASVAEGRFSAVIRLPDAGERTIEAVATHPDGLERRVSVRVQVEAVDQGAGGDDSGCASPSWIGAPALGLLMLRRRRRTLAA